MIGPNRTHGTTSCYKDGCRCVQCRAAAARYRRELRHKQGVIPRTKVRSEHGTVKRYRLGCKCDLCREASREARQNHRLTGTTVPGAWYDETYGGLL